MNHPIDPKQPFYACTVRNEFVHLFFTDLITLDKEEIRTETRWESCGTRQRGANEGWQG